MAARGETRQIRAGHAALRAALALALTLGAGLAQADEFDGVEPLTTDQIAKVKAEQEILRQDIVDQSQGDDTYDGIHAAKKAIRGSLQKVLDDNGVDKTQYLKELTHSDKEKRSEVEAKVKAIKEKTRADREAAAERETAQAEEAEHPKPKVEPEAKPAETAEAGPEMVRGFASGEGASGLPASITIPSKVDANGERTPEIILGFDEEHSAAAMAPQKADSNAESAPIPLDPPR